MGFDIPEPYKWDESFRVFYENLDAEHRAIFDGIFACDKNRGDAAALQSLIKVCKDHFADEEGMMAKSTKYGDLAAHKQKHDKFIADISKLSCPLNDDQIHFAKDWLVQHIKGTDFEYKEKL
ncbi:hemerythrin [Lingula anatina]|uniref:Hemerythrin n=1 Tax=Lingula anatina TaxID=7574 RepID=A0A1S3JJG8_LINAN|nr:hemerythrin [Lingula anatina]|eukprot:XP_013410049.1 hemerythrin [Lingula anatina]